MLLDKVNQNNASIVFPDLDDFTIWVFKDLGFKSSVQGDHYI